MRPALVTLLVTLLVAACSSPPGPSPAAAVTATAPPDAAPRLVVAVVLDQLPSEHLLRYLPELDEDGALRSLAARGVLVDRVRFSYAGTNTAPGHTAIHTGAAPAVNGVDTNDVWSDERQATISIIDDGVHPIFGDPTSFAGPARLRAETVADRLVASTDGAAKVVSLSFKARAAVVMGGKSPTAVAWYDADARKLTTSSYYAETLPDWLAEFAAAHPPTEMMVPWQAESPERYAELLGPDDAPGEADWRGLGTTFPYDIAASTDPYAAVVTTPASAEYLLDAARAAVLRFDLGGDDVPDLLAISISSTDYVGHSFGPDSWEYLDNLRRVDRALGVLLRDLEARGEIAVLVTSDHGGARLPETTKRGARIVPDELVARLDAAADEVAGDGDWIARYHQPYVFLTPAGQARRDVIVPALIAAADADPSVQGLYDPRVARTWQDSADPLERSIAQSVAPDRNALFLVPAEHVFSDPQRELGHGSSHGTPWDYDREVPVWFAGPGVTPAHVTETLAQNRVAATLSALLGIDAPANAAGKPLPGAPAR